MSWIVAIFIMWSFLSFSDDRCWTYTFTTFRFMTFILNWEGVAGLRMNQLCSTFGSCFANAPASASASAATAAAAAATASLLWFWWKTSTEWPRLAVIFIVHFGRTAALAFGSDGTWTSGLYPLWATSFIDGPRNTTTLAAVPGPASVSASRPMTWWTQTSAWGSVGTGAPAAAVVRTVHSCVISWTAAFASVMLRWASAQEHFPVPWRALTSTVAPPVSWTMPAPRVILL